MRPASSVCEGSRENFREGMVPMRIRVALFVLLTMVLAPRGFAQDKEIDIPFQKFVLDNGLTLIVHE